MNEKPNPEYVFFNPKPTGEPVNPHVFRIAPQRAPDFAKMQQLIRESAERMSAKKPEE